MEFLTVPVTRRPASYYDNLEFARRRGAEIGRSGPSANLSLTMQLLQPFEAQRAAMGRGDPVPVVVFFMGGGFRDPMVTVRVPMIARIAEMGFLVAMPAYRGTEKAPFPASAEDCFSALRYVKEHAAQYGGDPERIVLMGGSAGGYLALLTAYCGGKYRHQSDESAEAVKVSGVISLYGLHDLMFEGVSEICRGADIAGTHDPALIREKLAPADILRFISPEKKLPPTLLLHGEKDQVVPNSQSVEIFEELKLAGQDARLVIIREAAHADMRFFEPEPVSLYADFIRRVTK